MVIVPFFASPAGTVSLYRGFPALGKPAGTVPTWVSRVPLYSIQLPVTFTG